jgi:CDP-6-deoxy-D-xylo-4-hexulose-3-dehydrase
MRTETTIKDEIFDRVKEIYRIKKGRQAFVPGKTKIAFGGRVYDEKELINLVDASLEFWLTAGDYATQFESDLANYLGVRHCLLTNSGSSANLLAISSLTSHKLGDKKLRAGDEVITTACGFPTTLNPIIQNGLLPVFVDINIGTYDMQVHHIEEAISSKTKAIVVAHTLGNPAEIDTIAEIADENDLWLVEDNCDALGSKYKNQYTGTFGDVSTCSFYPAHHITTGEGGAVFTDNKLLSRIALSFRDWGRDCYCLPGHDNTCNKRFEWQLGDLPKGYDHKYIYSHVGYNLKMTDLQAAVGVEQLKKLPTFIDKRKENFKQLLKGMKRFSNYFVLPEATKNSAPNWFGFPLLVKEDVLFSRDTLVNFLELKLVATRMLFGGNLIKQPAYQEMDFKTVGSLRNTDLVMKNLFWIGIYPGITEDMIAYVLDSFSEFIEQKADYTA